MKQTQLKRILNSLLNGSCRQLSPKILFHKHFGGPPIGVTHSCRLLLSLFIISIELFVIGTNTTVNTSALTYSENVDVNFTFNPTISISLSYPDLIIEDLVPGSASDSNVITVTTSTNNVAGHILSASVGDGTTYTDTNLTNTTDIKNTDIFTSLATNASISGLNNINAGYWGYAYSTDNGTNWSNYSGLPYYNTSPKELASTNTNGTSSLEFKIAANADNWQMAGEYNNVINFYAVTKIPPTSFYDAFASAGKTKYNGYYAMQDMTASICNAVQTIDEDSQTRLIDTRDGKVYWVAKLKDGNCWMTQNLDLNLDSNTIYTSNDTDLNEYNANGYLAADGYSCSNPNTTSGCTASGEIIQWQPERSTIDAITTETTSISSISGWNNSANDPYSVDPGDWYWKGEYYDSAQQCPANSDNNYAGCNYMSKPSDNLWSTYFSTMPFAINGAHGHVGNYYNWSSAIASNNSSFYMTDTSDDTSANPKNSICPSGWRLPIITSYTTGNNEFYNLNYYYNNNRQNSDSGLISQPLYFVRVGDISGGILYVPGFNGVYWSSTVFSNERAGYLYFHSGTTAFYAEHSRSGGESLRCLAK